MLPLATVAAATAAATTAAAYLDAKYHIRHDLRYLALYTTFAKHLIPTYNELEKTGNASAYIIFKKTVEQWPDREGFVFEGRSWTYAQAERQVDKLASWLRTKNLQPKDTVSIFMSNSDLFIFIILALQKLAHPASLVNINLRDSALNHVISICESKLIIASEDTIERIKDVNIASIGLVELKYARENNERRDMVAREGIEVVYLTELEEGEKFPMVKTNGLDTAFYIYTSGTTGLSKAVCMPHKAFVMFGLFNSHYAHLAPNDRCYCCIPLYHTSGLAITLFRTIGAGATFIAARKFNARTFWKECRESRATSFQHVGELCRYLMLQPPSPDDRNHSVELVIGNGLKADIWEAFRERFGIKYIFEFYGQTEGQVGLYNYNAGPYGVGAVGLRGPLQRFLIRGSRIVKFDYDTEMPYRDPKTGFCVETDANEPGEAIGANVPGFTIPKPYLKNDKANKSKILRDVFEKGDAWERSGDLFKRDKDGRIYFIERIGDTFRWKGENVATDEIANYLSKTPFITEVVVYGVTLPHYDGQAGMAAIVLEKKDKQVIKQVAQTLVKTLIDDGVPSYAIPRFIRFVDRIPTTATHKYQKARLKHEGIDTEKCGKDKLFVIDREKMIYVPFEGESHRAVASGTAKL